jgi:hypothetical protein
MTAQEDFDREQRARRSLEEELRIRRERLGEINTDPRYVVVRRDAAEQFWKGVDQLLGLDRQRAESQKYSEFLDQMDESRAREMRERVQRLGRVAAAMKTRWDLARHESGHAVMAAVLGVPLFGARLDADGGTTFLRRSEDKAGLLVLRRERRARAPSPTTSLLRIAGGSCNAKRRAGGPRDGPRDHG